MLKSACIQKVLARAYTIEVFNPWYLQKKFGSPQWPIAQYEFRIRITRRFWNRIRKKFSTVNRGPNGVDWWKKPEEKISRYCPFKGTVVGDFFAKMISPKVLNWSPDSYTKDSNSPRNSTAKVLTRYGPLRQIWLCTVGYCGKFGCALWATAANLVIRYGPLRRIWLCAMGHYAVWGRTLKICYNFCAMDHSTGFGYVLWAVAKDLVKRYGPWRNIWLCAMGHSEKPITIEQNYATVFKSLPYPLKGQWCQKSVWI